MIYTVKGFLTRVLQTFAPTFSLWEHNWLWWIHSNDLIRQHIQDMFSESNATSARYLHNITIRTMNFATDHCRKLSLCENTQCFRGRGPWSWNILQHIWLDLNTFPRFPNKINYIHWVSIPWSQNYSCWVLHNIAILIIHVSMIPCVDRNPPPQSPLAATNHNLYTAPPQAPGKGLSLHIPS